MRSISTAYGAGRRRAEVGRRRLEPSGRTEVGIPRPRRRRVHLAVRSRRPRGPVVDLEHLDPLFVEVGVELLHLLLGYLDLLQRSRNLLERQEAALLPVRDQVAEFLKLRDRCVVRQQHA